jgi:hypothetical protein
MINPKQKSDMMTTDIPNAFVQRDVDEKNQVKGEHIIMKIRGPLMDMLLKTAPIFMKDYCLDLQKQDQGLLCQDAQSNLWYASVIFGCYITRSCANTLSLLDLK